MTVPVPGQPQAEAASNVSRWRTRAVADASPARLGLVPRGSSPFRGGAASAAGGTVYARASMWPRLTLLPPSIGPRRRPSSAQSVTRDHEPAVRGTRSDNQTAVSGRWPSACVLIKSLSVLMPLADADVLASTYRAPPAFATCERRGPCNRAISLGWYPRAPPPDPPWVRLA